MTRARGSVIGSSFIILSLSSEKSGNLARVQNDQTKFEDCFFPPYFSH